MKFKLLKVDVELSDPQVEASSKMCSFVCQFDALEMNDLASLAMLPLTELLESDCVSKTTCWGALKFVEILDLFSVKSRLFATLGVLIGTFIDLASSGPVPNRIFFLPERSASLTIHLSLH